MLKVFGITTFCFVGVLERFLAESRSIQVCANKPLDSRVDLLFSTGLIRNLILDVRACKHSRGRHIASCIRKRRAHGAQDLTTISERFLDYYLKQLLLEPG